MAAEAEAGREAGREAEAEATKLTEAEVGATMGYPADAFQVSCLEVIVDERLDLLAMAPTGSGKTAVALIAILQAFRRGKKAVYTSPIKALSNQKYLPPTTCHLLLTTYYLLLSTYLLGALQPEVRGVQELVRRAQPRCGRDPAHG